MKKGIFTLTIVAFIFAFTSCQPEEKVVTLSFSGDIMVDLGDTDADVLKFVTASDGSAVTVSGIDYNKAGEQTGTFKAGDVTENKIVKVKAEKLAGRYSIAYYTADGGLMTQGDGWKIKVVEGDAYNQIKIPSTIETGDKTILTDIESLIVTFNGTKEPTIEDYEGGFLFMTTPSTAEWEFSEIEYGLDESGKYAIKGFRMDGYKAGYDDFYYTAKLTKIK